MSLNWEDRRYFRQMGIALEDEPEEQPAPLLPVPEPRRLVNWAALGAGILTLALGSAFWWFFFWAGTRLWPH
jgi:hypothetical protein